MVEFTLLHKGNLDIEQLNCYCRSEWSTLVCETLLGAVVTVKRDEDLRCLSCL